MAFTEAKHIIEDQDKKLKELQVIIEGRNQKSQTVELLETKTKSLEVELQNLRANQERVLAESLSEAWKVMDQQKAEIALLKRRLSTSQR
jgi:3-dehydroquinate dehydratase